MMAKLSKRLEIRLPDELGDRLTEIAKRDGCSVATLVREAVVARYGRTSQQEKLAAVERLATLHAPAPDWERMEAEIVAGALEMRAPDKS
ncbi:MAG: ribbon-helix-helix protein, CopG family [Gemmatimonadetes bacterium]|jgi:predicted transcriptional regulator|nr:ribbon-helix-helix protein, CopG family [Gemmatimonadota bacterium]